MLEACRTDWRGIGESDALAGVAFGMQWQCGCEFGDIGEANFSTIGGGLVGVE